MGLPSTLLGSRLGILGKRVQQLPSQFPIQIPLPKMTTSAILGLCLILLPPVCGSGVEDIYFVNGTVVIGGIFTIHTSDKQYTACGEIDPYAVFLSSAMEYTLDFYNDEKDGES